MGYLECSFVLTATVINKGKVSEHKNNVDEVICPCAKHVIPRPISESGEHEHEHELGGSGGMLTRLLARGSGACSPDSEVASGAFSGTNLMPDF